MISFEKVYPAKYRTACFGFILALSNLCSSANGEVYPAMKSSVSDHSKLTRSPRVMRILNHSSKMKMRFDLIGNIFLTNIKVSVFFHWTFCVHIFFVRLECLVPFLYMLVSPSCRLFMDSLLYQTTGGSVLWQLKIRKNMTNINPSMPNRPICINV